MNKAFVFRAAHNLFAYMHNQTWKPEDLSWDMEYISDEEDKDSDRTAIKYLYELLNAGMSVKDFSNIVAYAADAEKNMTENTLRTLCNMIFDAAKIKRDEDGIDYLVSTFKGQK